MFKGKWLVAVAVLVLAGAGTANAALYWDLDDFEPDIYMSRGDKITGTFDIATGDGSGQPGFDPDTEEVENATFTMMVDDDGWDLWEKVTVELGPLKIFDKVEVDFNTELNFGIVGGSILADLNADGVLSYEIIRKQGDFYVDWTRLDAETPDDVIPEPASIAIWSLLGGLGLIVGWRRRRRAA